MRVRSVTFLGRRYEGKAGPRKAAASLNRSVAGSQASGCLRAIVEGAWLALSGIRIGVQSWCSLQSCSPKQGWPDRRRPTMKSQGS